jgi:hypothetical protein
MLEDYAPEVPDWALDMHTLEGKAMGRGLDHFRSEGTKLIPPPTEPDLSRTRLIGCGRSSSGGIGGPGWSRNRRFYQARLMPGGRHVPSPAGRIEGGVGFGQ